MQLKLALEASAGSGKTFSLTLRYIELLFLGATPSSIVALTFTKKSANEMKERIISTLQNLHEKEAELNVLCETLGISKEEIFAKKSAILQSFNQSSISIETIDAFISRVLRKFSLHCSLMPDFSVVASLGELESSFFAQIIKENLLGEFIKFCIQSGKKDSDMLRFFGLLWQKRAEFEKCEIVEHSWVGDEEIFEALLKLEQYATNKGGSTTAINSFKATSVTALMQKGFLERESLDYRTYSKIYTPELDELFFNLKELLCARMRAYEFCMLGNLKQYFSIYSSVREGLIAKNTELEFIDITNLVNSLLTSGLDRDFLYFRLDGAISHLLIDEFQDTSVTQYEILAPIMEEISSGVGAKEGRSLFYVGDVKQSIYRFRGGEQSLFYEVANRFGVSVEALDRNFRSKSVIVEFVNETFDGVMEHYKRQIPTKDGGFVQIKEDDEVLEALVVGVGELLQLGVQSDEIAILCRTNADALEIEDELKSKFEGVHVGVHAKLLLRDLRSVKILIECAKYSYFQEPIYWEEVNSFVHVQRKVFDFGSDLALSFKQMVEYLGLDGSDLNIVYFLESVQRFGSIEEFLFSLEGFNDEAPMQKSSGIKILTIHKSKGLEFDYLFVCDKFGKNAPNSDPFIFDYDNITLNKIYFRQKNRLYVDAEFENIVQKEAQRAKIDELNLMYVALTRAKEALFVIKKEKNSLFLDELNLTTCTLGNLEVKLQKEQEHQSFTQFLTPRKLQPQNYKKDEDGGSFEARLFGIAVHEIFEFANEFSKVEFERVWRSISKKYYFGDEPLKRAFGLLDNELFVSLLNGAKVYKEQPLVFNTEQKQIDLMLEFEDKVIVIDYKTSNKFNTKDKKQVLFYKEAVENILKKDTFAYLFYLHVDSVEVISL